MPDDLIQSHLWIVERFATTYYCLAPGADLRAAGHLGLVEAASRYKRKRGTAFSTYAWNWVKGSILSEMRRNHVVPVPEHLARQACKDGAPIRGVTRFVEPAVPVDGEQEGATSRAMQLRALRDVLHALENPEQRAVIDRTLSGQTVAQIAKGLKLTHKRVEELLCEAQALLAGAVSWKT